MIVGAARALPPQDLSIRAVAAALGVDRKSVHYYVKDRAGLQELVAIDVFEAQIRGWDIPRDADWRELLRAVAYAMRSTLSAVGSLLTYTDIQAFAGIDGLRATEDMLQRLIAAGFTVEEAGLAYKFVSDLAYCGAREDLRAASERHGADGGSRGRRADIRDTLPNAEGNEDSALRQLVELRSGDRYRDRQFDFGLRVLVVALERLVKPTGVEEVS